MYFTVKEVLLHGARKVTIYSAMGIPSQLRFIDPIEWNRVILANSAGFKYIRDMFMIAATHKKRDSIFYIEDNSLTNEQYKEWWKIGRFHLNMAVFNYHCTQLDTKDINRAINISRNIQGKREEISVSKIKLEWKLPWLIDRKLCTKSYKNKFIISGNRDVLLQLAYDTNGFVEIEDDEDYNMDCHTHRDHIGTKKYNGMDFFYFYQKQE